MALYAAAGSMAVGGVVQMLSPQVSGLRMRQEPDNKPSYAFGGPVNTTASGNPYDCFFVCIHFYLSKEKFEAACYSMCTPE